MKRRGFITFWAYLMIIALSLALIPIIPGTNTYAETNPASVAATVTEPDFVVPVTQRTEVPEGYVGIYTKADLDNIRNNPYWNYILMNDIIFAADDFTVDGAYYNSGTGWIPIENYYGILDGNGYRVDGIKINRTTNTSYVTAGFVVYNRGTIRNLCFENASITTSSSITGVQAYSGCIATDNYGGIIENCVVCRGNIQSTGRAGGVTVFNSGTIRYCYNDATISVESTVTQAHSGGIASANHDGVIEYCINAGDISARHTSSASYGASAGGLTARNEQGVIRACYNSGNVYAFAYRSSAHCGGIAGFAYDSTYPGTIQDCYNIGEVCAAIDINSAGQPYGGGVIGHNLDYITCCYNIGTVKSFKASAALNCGGVAGKNDGTIQNSYTIGGVNYNSEGQTISKSDLLEQGTFAGFDFQNVWSISMEGDYPYPDLINNQYVGPPIYTVKYDSVGGTALPVTVTCSELLEPVNPTRPGYTFAGWFKDEAYQVPWVFGTDIVTDNLTLYAKWTPVQYAIYYTLNGGTNSTQNIAAYTVESTEIIIYDPTRAGYQFEGWYTGQNFTGDRIESISPGGIGDVNLFAKWTANIYTIKFSGNGSTSGTMSSLGMTYDSVKALPAIAFKKIGYSFLGWATSATGSVVYKDLASVKNLTATNGAAITLYAKWGASITSATSYNYNSIKVSWAYAGSATSYKIYRATSATGTYSLVYTATSTSRSWVNTSLITGKSYYYKVYPVAGGKTYAHSTYKYTKAIPTTPTVTLSKASTTSIKVTWTGVSGATKYQVYRATSATGTYTLVYTASSTLRTWTNTGLTAGKTYYYKVRAYHLEGSTNVYGGTSTVKYLKL